MQAAQDDGTDVREAILEALVAWGRRPRATAEAGARRQGLGGCG